MATENQAPEGGPAQAAEALVQAVQRDWPHTTTHRATVLAAAGRVCTALATQPQAETCGSGAGCLHKDALIDHLREQLAAKQAPAEGDEAQGFSPMYLAPLDGTPVMLYMPTTVEKFAVGQWHGSPDSLHGNWGDDEGNYYVHDPVCFIALSNLERLVQPSFKPQPKGTGEPVAEVGCDDHGAAVKVGTSAHFYRPLPTGTLLYAVQAPAPAHPQLWRDGGPTTLDPHKIQLCRVGVHSTDAQAMGQNCDCQPGTCSMWNGGLKPAVEAPAVKAEPAWVWNPAVMSWEPVRAPGCWQQGAIYAFGPTAPDPLTPSAQQEAEPYGGTEMPYEIVPRPRDEVLRLLSWITRSVGNDHPAYDDVERLAAFKPPVQPMGDA